MARCLLGLVAAGQAARAAGESLAVCLAGRDQGEFQRAMVHRSLRHNLMEGLGAARADLFAEVAVETPQAAEEMRRLLTEGLQARSSRVSVGGASLGACGLDAQAAASPERFLQGWQAVEGCFQQVLQAEEADGSRYDWVLRVSPDMMWHGRADALGSFSPVAVSVARQADAAFLSPRGHAEAAFRGVMDRYRECEGGKLTVTAASGASFFQDVLEGLGVQQVRRAFKGVGLRPRADDGLARQHCLAASLEGLDQDACMRLLYGRRPEPALPPLEPVQSDPECSATTGVSLPLAQAKVLIATPLKNAARHLPGFATALQKLSYPKHLLSVAFLVSDSHDGTADLARQAASGALRGFSGVEVFEEDFQYEAPADRHALQVQASRRAVLAGSRNELLRRALRRDTFAVLWLDVDITGYPATLVQDLLAVGRPIVAPHVLIGRTTYDKNSWRENYPEEAFAAAGVPAVAFEGYQRYEELAAGAGSRDHMDVLSALVRALGARERTFAVRLDGVGAGVLLVQARVHRDAGVLFPEVPYKHRLESEGFGLRAADLGFPACGLPLYEVSHRDEWAEERRLNGDVGKGNSTSSSTTSAPSTTTAATTAPPSSTAKPGGETTSASTTAGATATASTTAGTAASTSTTAGGKATTTAAVKATTTAAVSTTTSNSTANTTTQPAGAVVRVSADIVMDNLTAFNETALRASLAEAANLDLDAVDIVSVTFKVVVEYTFASTVTAAQARRAIAQVHGVPESRVEVTVTAARRLLAGSRRLASSGVEATIVSDNASAAEAVQSSASNASAVTTSLAQLGVTTTATVRTAPVSKVSVVTALRTPSGSTATASAASWVQAAGSAVGGTVTVTGLSVTGGGEEGEAPTPGVASAAPPAGCALALLLGPALALAWHLAGAHGLL